MSSKISLPRIDQRGNPSGEEVSRTHGDLGQHSNDQIDKQEYVSPFRLPTDDEVFVYREVERKKRDDLKKMSQDLKIWDKKTGTSQRPLRLFKNTEIPLKDNTKITNQHASGKGYNTKEKAVIVEAQKVINDRRKNRDTNGKEQNEGIVELLEQKKEMFLVEMTVGILEKEIDVLNNRAGEKEDALKKSQEMLEKDLKEFEGFRQKNKQDTDQAVQQHNQEVDMRKKTETDYKIKNNDLTSLKAETTKNEELIQKYRDAKIFLEKLTPKDVLENRQKELSAKIEDFKTMWLDREINKEEVQSGISENLLKGANKEKRSNAKKIVKLDLEKVFQEKLDRGEFDEIEEFKLGQKMYFTDSNQLIEIFMRLEENNLSLIQGMQETEQNLDNLRNSLKQKKFEFDKKIGGLRENKMQLDKNRHEKEEKIRALNAKFKEPTLTKTNDGVTKMTKKIIEIVEMFKDEARGTVSLESLPTLDLLASIEMQLERLLKKLNEHKASRVVELKRGCEDERKRENWRMQQAKEALLAEEKSKRASMRGKDESKKRKGRLDMTKSIPIDKKEVVVQVVTTDEEEEGMKYFKPYLTKF